MNYAVTFTNNYGRVSVVIDGDLAESPEDAIKKAIESNVIKAFHAIEVSVVISTDSRAKAFNDLTEAKALFI